jgi:hypothetical protein
MLNRYQNNVIVFFRAYAELFVRQLLVSLPDNYTFVTDILPKIVDFIDNQIKKEMALHDVKSEGYNRYLDMLIEIHSPLSDEFKTAIVEQINDVFIQ